MVKTFKVSIKASEEVDASNMDEAFIIACKMILRDIGVANINEEVLGKMEEKFIYSVTGKKE
jgi:hypothetical protein